jgi:hypothetical protein
MGGALGAESVETSVQASLTMTNCDRCMIVSVNANTNALNGVSALSEMCERRHLVGCAKVASGHCVIRSAVILGVVVGASVRKVPMRASFPPGFQVAGVMVRLVAAVDTQNCLRHHVLTE